MSNPQRAKGTRYERKICQLLNKYGLPAVRLPFNNPTGDLEIQGIPMVFECKNWYEPFWNLWIKQAQLEAERLQVDDWAVIAHSSGNGNYLEDHVMIPVKTLIHLLQAYHEQI